jgi:hypothetical protein
MLWLPECYCCVDLTLGAIGFVIFVSVCVEHTQLSDTVLKESTNFKIIKTLRFFSTQIFKNISKLPFNSPFTYYRVHPHFYSSFLFLFSSLPTHKIIISYIALRFTWYLYAAHNSGLMRTYLSFLLQSSVPKTVGWIYQNTTFGFTLEVARQF